jgi:hypothetical protein
MKTGIIKSSFFYFAHFWYNKYKKRFPKERHYERETISKSNGDYPEKKTPGYGHQFIG